MAKRINELENDLQKRIEHNMQAIHTQMEYLDNALLRKDLMDVVFTACAIQDFARDIEVIARAIHFLQKYGDKDK